MQWFRRTYGPNLLLNCNRPACQSDRARARREYMRQRRERNGKGTPDSYMARKSKEARERRKRKQEESEAEQTEHSYHKPFILTHQPNRRLRDVPNTSIRPCCIAKLGFLFGLLLQKVTNTLASVCQDKRHMASLATTYGLKNYNVEMCVSNPGTCCQEPLPSHPSTFL
eukprot:COSAG02_NODE_8640_length_2495_cov_1.951586_2_plen_169_part_00